MPAKKKSKKAPPPPPPTILYATTQEEFDALVLQHKASCLVAVVTPFCNRCSRTVMPYLEKLNSERPRNFSRLNIVVINAGEDSAELCEALEVVAVPTFFAYSYGRLLHTFSGDNMEKVLLLVKIAVQQAEVDEKEAAAVAAAAAKENEGIADAVVTSV